MNIKLVSLPVFARIPVSMALLSAIVATAPQSLEEARSEQWKNGNHECAAILRRGDQMTLGGDPEIRADFEQSRRYWLTSFAGLSERTRSIITLSFDMLAQPFVTSPLRRLFSTHTTLKPED